MSKYKDEGEINLRVKASQPPFNIYYKENITSKRSHFENLKLTTTTSLKKCYIKNSWSVRLCSQ